MTQQPPPPQQPVATTPQPEQVHQAPTRTQEALVQSGTVGVHAETAVQTAAQVAPAVNFNDPDLHHPGQGHVNQGVTVFLFGSVGTWKTTWAGQWPKAVFLSVGAEGGDDALAMLPSIYGVNAPPAYHITSAKMMKEKVDFLAAHYVQLGVNTVVIDSISYYVDMWIAELMGLRYNDPKIRRRIEKAGGEATNMTMSDWGLIAMHIRDLAMKLHNTKLNVIWIALEKETRESDGQQGSSSITGVQPYIKGEMNIKLPGMCKMIIHAHKDLKPDPNAIGRMMVHPTYYTSPNWLTKIVRHKYGNAFPEGKLVDPHFGDLPTFNGVLHRIGNFVYRT